MKRKTFLSLLILAFLSQSLSAQDRLKNFDTLNTIIANTPFTSDQRVYLAHFFSQLPAWQLDVYPKRLEAFLNGWDAAEKMDILFWLLIDDSSYLNLSGPHVSREENIRIAAQQISHFINSDHFSKNRQIQDVLKRFNSIQQLAVHAQKELQVKEYFLAFGWSSSDFSLFAASLEFETLMFRWSETNALINLELTAEEILSYMSKFQFSILYYFEDEKNPDSRARAIKNAIINDDISYSKITGINPIDKPSYGKTLDFLRIDIPEDHFSLKERINLFEDDNLPRKDHLSRVSQLSQIFSYISQMSYLTEEERIFFLETYFATRESILLPGVMSLLGIQALTGEPLDVLTKIFFELSIKEGNRDWDDQINEAYRFARAVYGLGLHDPKKLLDLTKAHFVSSPNRTHINFIEAYPKEYYPHFLEIIHLITKRNSENSFSSNIQVSLNFYEALSSLYGSEKAFALTKFFTQNPWDYEWESLEKNLHFLDYSIKEKHISEDKQMEFFEVFFGANSIKSDFPDSRDSSSYTFQGELDFWDCFELTKKTALKTSDGFVRYLYISPNLINAMVDIGFQEDDAVQKLMELSQNQAYDLHNFNNNFNILARRFKPWITDDPLWNWDLLLRANQTFVYNESIGRSSSSVGALPETDEYNQKDLILFAELGLQELELKSFLLSFFQSPEDFFKWMKSVMPTEKIRMNYRYRAEYATIPMLYLPLAIYYYQNYGLDYDQFWSLTASIGPRLTAALGQTKGTIYRLNDIMNARGATLGEAMRYYSTSKFLQVPLEDFMPLNSYQNQLKFLNIFGGGLEK